MKAFILGIVVIMIASGGNCAEQSELEVLKRKYDDAHFTICLDFGRQSSDALSVYGKTLDSYMSSLKKAGRLDEYLELAQEKTRLAEEDSVTSGVSSNIYITKASGEYSKVIAQRTIDKKKRVVFLAQQYEFMLNSLMKKTMQADQIEDAKLVKLEQERCQAVLTGNAPEENPKPPAVKQAAPVKPVRRIGLRKNIPKDALEHRGHHYVLVSERLTWHAAKEKCEEMGGHLVTATGPTEEAFVKKIPGSPFWMGATDEKEEGKWVWVTGESFHYSDWGRKSPGNIRGTQHYLYMDARSYTWDDCQIDYRGIRAYVCEWDY